MSSRSSRIIEIIDRALKMSSRSSRIIVFVGVGQVCVCHKVKEINRNSYMKLVDTCVFKQQVRRS